MKIRKLASYFRENGFEHELVKRVGNTELLEKEFPAS
jgi:hypothetical protein